MSVVLRDYQVAPARVLSTALRGIVKAPAGSGKTIIGAAAIDRLLRRNELRMAPQVLRIVWLANTREQCDQADAALGAFRIRERAVVSVACYAGAPEEAVRKSDLLVADECHHVAAPETAAVVRLAGNLRWGLSATPDRADERASIVYELLGPIVATVERSGLVVAGQLARALVHFHTPNEPNEFVRVITAKAESLIVQRRRFWRGVPEDEVRKRTLWQVCQEIGLFENAKRNAKVLALAREHAGESVLILVGKITQGEAYAASLPGAVVMHSKMKKRAEALQAFRDGALQTVIATSLADEGMDVPRASVLILAAGGRSSAKAEQRTGRVLRAWGDKTHGVIHDFWDWQHYFLLAQSKARRRVYESLGYRIEDPSQGHLAMGRRAA